MGTTNVAETIVKPAALPEISNDSWIREQTSGPKGDRRMLTALAARYSKQFCRHTTWQQMLSLLRKAWGETYINPANHSGSEKKKKLPCRRPCHNIRR